MKQTTPALTPSSRFRVHFHDYVHGRISFIREVESPSIGEATSLARVGIVMPPYVIANFVSYCNPDPKVVTVGWSSFPPDTPPEPPLLRTPLSDPEIRLLTELSPEEDHRPQYGYDGGEPSVVDWSATPAEIMTAINRYPHLITDAGDLREDIWRCSEFGEMLRHPLLSVATDNLDLRGVVKHLSHISGVAESQVWLDLRADAWEVVERDGGLTPTPQTATPANSPLSGRQDHATLEGVGTEVETETDQEDQ